MANYLNVNSHVCVNVCMLMSCAFVLIQMSVASIRRNNKKQIYIRKCGPVLFGITTVFFVSILYWVYFDLRQQISDYQLKFEEGKNKHFKLLFLFHAYTVGYKIIRT